MPYTQKEIACPHSTCSSAFLWLMYAMLPYIIRQVKHAQCLHTLIKGVVKYDGNDGSSFSMNCLGGCNIAIIHCQ